MGEMFESSVDQSSDIVMVGRLLAVLEMSWSGVREKVQRQNISVYTYVQ